MYRRTSPLVAFAILALATSTFGAEYYVEPGDGTNVGTKKRPMGLWWALGVVDNNGEDDVLHLARGTYEYDTGYRYDAITYGDQRLTIIGGYDADFSARSTDASLTVISGGGVRAAMSIGSSWGVSARVTIEGVTFRNGYKDSGWGAGLSLYQDPLSGLEAMIENCRFVDNVGAGTCVGGGLWSNCETDILDSVFVGNRAANGGAVYLMKTPHGKPDSIFLRCRFEDNAATGDSVRQGTAIYTHATLHLALSTFLGPPGGTGSQGSGSAIYVDDGAWADVDNTIFSGLRTDESGSAITFDNAGGGVRNCLFVNNRCGLGGFGQGTVYVTEYDGPGDLITITNNTFADCRSGESTNRGGAISFRNHVTSVVNCVVWDCGGRPVYNETASWSPTVRYCFVDGGITDANVTDGGGNLLAPAASPFAGDDDYHLDPDSPCVDAGDNGWAAQPTDLDEAARVFDGDGDGTATVDMGAYEIAPRLVAVPDRVDFEATHAGNESAVQTVTVLNAGTAPLAIGTATVTGSHPGDFTIADDQISGLVLSPSDQRTVQVSFTPTVEGSRNATLSIPAAVAGGPGIEIFLSGYAKPPLVVAPMEGGVGCRLTVTCAGFGDRSGKVGLEYLNQKGKWKLKTFKVLTWTDTTVTCWWSRKFPTGEYDLVVEPRSGPEFRVAGFALAGPSVDAIDRVSGAPGDLVEIEGAHFGHPKAKPKLYLEYTKPGSTKTKRKKCKVEKSSLAFDETTGASGLVFRIPKLGPVTGRLVLRTKLGETTASPSFTVE